MEEEVIIACGPVSRGPTAIENSRIELCSACGTEIWVSPSSFELKPTKLMCLPCIFEKFSPEEPVLITPGILDDLAQVAPEDAAWVKEKIEKGFTVEEVKKLYQK